MDNNNKPGRIGSLQAVRAMAFTGIFLCHAINTFPGEGILYYVLGSMTENINNDGNPDGVYFIVEFDGENLDVAEKHIKL